MVDIYENKEALLQKKPKNLFIFSIFTILLLISMFVYITNIKVYDHYITKGYVECEENCYIISLIPTNISLEKIKINNKNWEYNLQNKKIEIDKDELVSYYRVSFTNNLNYSDSEIVDLNFYYNKQSIFNKLKKEIF